MIPSPPTRAWGLLAGPWMGPELVSVQMSAGMGHAGRSLLTEVWAPVASALAGPEPGKKVCPGEGELPQLAWY